MAMFAPFRSVLAGATLFCATGLGGLTAADEPWDPVHIATPSDRADASEVDQRQPRSLRSLLTGPVDRPAAAGVQPAAAGAQPGTKETANRQALKTVRRVGFLAGEEQPMPPLRALPTESLPPGPSTDHDVSLDSEPAPVNLPPLAQAASCRCGKQHDCPGRPHSRKKRDEECRLVKVLDGVAAGIEHSLKLKPPHQRHSGQHGSPCPHCASGAAASPTRGRSVQGPTFTPVPKPLSDPGLGSVQALQPELHPEAVPAGPPARRCQQPSSEQRPGEISPRRLPRLPAPMVPDELSDPFEDDSAWLPGRDPSIRRSAYFE